MAEKRAISLVIPLYNERATVGELLASIAAQRRAPDEIVAVDAGSTDDTAAQIEAHRGVLPITLVRSPVRLMPGAARNLGVARATKPFVAFTDAGIRLDPAWLAELDEVQARTNAELVFGAYEPVVEDAFDQWLAIACIEAPRLVSGKSIRTDVVPSSLVSKRLFEAAGGFREDLRSAEDLLFLKRCRQLTRDIAYAPRALVRWRMPANVRATFMRFLRYSEHNLRAGLYDEWQRTLVRRYAKLAALSVGVGWWAGPLITPPAFAGLTVGQWLLRARARMGRYEAASLPVGRRIPTLLGTAALTAVIDAATFSGLAVWLAKGAPRK